MNSSMSMLAFLLVVLVAGVVLFAVIGSGPKRHRSGRSSGRDSGRSTVTRLDRTQIADRWTTIQAMATGGGNGLRTAISEADKLVDHVLRQQGLAGDTMGERLKSARTHFPDRQVYDGLWRAHKLRNALAHEVGFDLVPSQAREALNDFHRALIALGAL